MKKAKMEAGFPQMPEQETLKIKFPEIKFPNDIEIVKKLQDKLQQYKRRLKLDIESVLRKNPNASPEEISRASADTNYKIAVLEKLLLEGKVDGQQLSQELKEKEDKFYDEGFKNACLVIEDYAKTGGKNTIGGLGL